jgi:hypothetical protein
MLNDEQILLKTAKLLENLDISAPKVADLYEFKEKVLREVTEDEMRVLEDVLDDLDPANLPLNDLFGGKMRAVIPFPTIDPSTDLGKFAKFFDSQEYNVDWDKGMVFAERDIRTSDDLLDTLIGMQGGQPEKKKVKKIQMKIGKLFKKIADLSSKKDALYQKVYDYLAGIGYKGPNGQPITKWHEVTVKMRNAALDEKELENVNRINEQMYLYIVNPGVAGPAGYNLTELATKYAEYWQKNAAFIKKEINNLDNDKYSIIITRHPVDVLRMSDFDKITSCHSPASRTNAYQSYYKCAVAEARGHGAVAYVVETDELLSATNTGNIDSAEQEIQEGEIFYDDQRHDVGDINPISRTRIRHVRYYDTDEPARYDDGQDVGMPEKRVYGADIPGLADTVVDWARSNQEEVIKNMPSTNDDNEDIDLNRFMIFGGSYEDTANAEGRKELLSILTQIEPEAMNGSMKQNRDTEDDLDADLIGDIRASYENQCQEIIDTWNQRAAVTKIGFDVEDDGGDGVYIRGAAEVVIEWDKSDWTRLPTAIDRVVQYSPDAINDIYGDLFTDRAYMGRQGDTIFWTCGVNLEHPELGGQSYYVMPEEFNEACQKIDSIIDDRHDAWKEILSTYFKREGQMVGGEYMSLAMDIENGEIDSYEWDVETDGEYEDSYESYASVSFEYDSEEWKMSPQILERLLDSREFKLLLRQNMLAAPRQEVGTEYHLDIAHYTVTRSGGERVVQIQFKVDSDDNAERVELFKELVTGEMDDEDNLTVIFNKTLAQIQAQNMSGTWTDDVNEQLVGNWRRFIS